MSGPGQWWMGNTWNACGEPNVPSQSPRDTLRNVPRCQQLRPPSYWWRRSCWAAAHSRLCSSCGRSMREGFRNSGTGLRPGRVSSPQVWLIVSKPIYCLSGHLHRSLSWALLCVNCVVSRRIKNRTLCSRLFLIFEPSRNMSKYCFKIKYKIQFIFRYVISSELRFNAVAIRNVILDANYSN